MKMHVYLAIYQGEKDAAVDLIRQFWKAHNNYNQSKEEALADLEQWTDSGHEFFFIHRDDETVGFIHLGSRGNKPDWLEDVFVVPRYQNQGIGTSAIKIMEEEVKKYSDSLYIEAAARNQGAIRLYQKLGYNCLNTITIRKDFNEEKFDIVRKVNIYDADFEIRKLKFLS